MNETSTSSVIRFGHSPDADDAFMFYGLAKEIASVPGYRIEHVMQDIQTLNRRAMASGDLEVTAVSAAVYPHIAHRYRILSTGASMGRGYGPRLVSRQFENIHELAGGRIAIPGEHTTAFMLLQVYLGSAAKTVEFLPVHFERIPEVVIAGEAEAGLIIHEVQLTYGAMGLNLVADLGLWWQRETGLPLPLGLDVVRRDLGESLSKAINRGLRSSIEAAYADEEAALDYALSFGRGLERETCRTFVRMYVNQDTLDMGEAGERALEALFRRAYQAGLLASVPPVEIVRG